MKRGIILGYTEVGLKKGQLVRPDEFVPFVLEGEIPEYIKLLLDTYDNERSHTFTFRQLRGKGNRAKFRELKRAWRGR